MKKLFLLLLLASAISFLFLSKKGKVIKNVAVSYVTTPDLINPEGMTVATRTKLPEGFLRKVYPPNSFSEYIQQYPLKTSEAKVINYDGNEYVYQTGHIGVLEVPVPSNGLQQCADALIRLRAEYLWEQNRKAEIGFKFTSGHYCSWSKYSEGYRPKINGNKVTFSKTKTANASIENFYNYLNLIYMYAGTQSLHDELQSIDSVSEVEVGDMLIYPGFPGHVVMIADKATNESGEILFILAQGNTPAQSVHMLKNLNDSTTSPWYDLELGAYLEIPTYYFNDTKFIRFN